MPNTNDKNEKPVAVTTKENTPKPKKEEKETKVEKKTKITRAPRARKVEELINEATKKMTDKEKDILIAFLRQDTTVLKNQITALKDNIEAVHTKMHMLEKQYEDMEKFYRDNLAYIDGQVLAMVNAVRRSTVGGAK